MKNDDTPRKPKRNGDSMRRFSMPEPEGTIKSTPPVEPEAGNPVSELQRRFDLLMASPYRKSLQMTVDMMFNEMQASPKPKCAWGEDLTRMLQVSLEGPRKEFVREAIEFAFCATITSRKNY